MGKVIGVGGVFLNFKGEKEEVHRFYKMYLGLEMSEYGSSIIEGGQLMLLSYKREGENVPLINFRVDNIDELMRTLREINLQTDEVAIFDYGKFAHFTDPFGNFIELWEPHEENYKKMVREEIERYLDKF